MAKARAPSPAELRAFIERFQPIFGRRDRLSACHEYLTGLLAKASSSKKSVASTAATPHAVRQFVNRSPWDDESILSALRARLFSHHTDPDAALVLTEVCIRKKGRHSVGVHLRSGSDPDTGLTPGGRYQCVVIWCWVTRTRAWPVAARLYLPASWTLNTRQTRRGGIPARFSHYQDKTVIALDLLDTIRHQMKEPCPVIIDQGFTGEVPLLVRELENRALHYVLAVRHPQPPGSPGGYPDLFSPVEEWIGKVTFLQCLQHLEQTVYESVQVHGAAGNPVIRLAGDIDPRGPNQRSPQRFLLCHRERSHHLQLYITNKVQENSGPSHFRMVRKLKTVRRMCTELLANGGLRRFEGRTWRGFHHHITLCFMAYYFSMMQLKHK